MSWAILMHSQKGSEWKQHEYIKREGTEGHYEDGKYYYPDSYEGGRHLPKGDKDGRSTKRDFGNTDRSNMQDWEKKVHEHLDKIIADHPDMFKSGKDVVAGIMDEKNLQSVKNTLKAFGLNPDKMSDAEVKQLRKQIADYYDKAAADEMESTSSKSKSSKSSKKSKSTKKEEKEEDKDKNKKKSGGTDTKKKETKKITQVNTGYYTTGDGPKERNHYAKEEERKRKLKHSIWYISSKDSIAHHGVLGQKHGVRNGPPYPLGSGDHSASEKKAGWRKSLADGV